MREQASTDLLTTGGGSPGRATNAGAVPSSRHRQSRTDRRPLRSLVACVALVAAALGGWFGSADALNGQQASIVSANPADSTPFIKDGQVLAVAQVGNRIIAGGHFTQAKNWQGGEPVLTRVNLLAFDATTGRLDTTFAPTVDGDVLALAPAPDGTAVFIGGKFKNVNGVAAGGIAKLNAATGQQVSGFSLGTNGWVQDLEVRGNRLFLSGTFSIIKALARSGFGAADATTGKVDPNVAPVFSDPVSNSLQVQKFDVTADGTRAVALGTFSKVNGLPRRFLVVLDLTTVPATVAPWNTQRMTASCNIPNYLRAVDISPDGRYFVLTTTGGWGGNTSMCDTASRWELYQIGDALQPTWAEYTGGDSLYSVAVTGSVVYVGGHQRWMNNSNPPYESAGPGYVDRPGLAALDPQTGVVFSWNPTRDRGYGVTAMLATSSGLWIGHDTNVVAGEWHPRIAFFPLAGGTVVPTVAPATLPTTLYRGAADGTLSAQSFDGTTSGAPTVVDATVGWGQVRGAFMANGKVYMGRTDGTFQVQTFDGAAFGSATNLNAWISFADVTGMFLREGRLYFTRAGDPNLYYRFFNIESNVIGSYLFVASGNGDGLDWRATAGMTSAGGKLFAASTDGTLRSFVLGADGKPVPTSAAVIGGPAVDGRNWASTALFTLHRAP